MRYADLWLGGMNRDEDPCENQAIRRRRVGGELRRYPGDNMLQLVEH